MALKTSQMHVKDWDSLRANWPKKKEEKPKEEKENKNEKEK